MVSGKDRTPENDGAKHKLQIKFLSDEPTNSDFFGGHRNTALAIKNIIAEKDSGKIIGIFGSWGSGKSTVIKILQEEIDNSDLKDSISIFVFDAWTHQKDPIRRSFLENIIAYLSRKLIDFPKKRKWDKELEKIKGQKETHTIESSSSISLPGKFMLGAILFFTIFITLLGKDCSQNKCDFNGYFSYETKIRTGNSVILIKKTLIPKIEYFVFLHSSFYVSILFLVAGFVFWIFSKKDHGNKDFFSLFLKQTTDEVETEVIRTPDPTAIEFQELFLKIRDALPPGYKLSIVVDNLDRIPEEDAIDMWATIRSIFGTSDGTIEKSSENNLSVILPFSPDSILHLFRTPDENTKDGRANSFINKTFDVIFQVGPPLLSDWSDYFYEKAKEAYSDSVKQEDIHKVVRLYDIYVSERPNEALGITPRKIKILLNSIGSLLYQWEDKIPFPVLGLYSIYHNNFANNADEIMNLISKRSEQLINNSRWKDYICAIFYSSTDIDKAIQVHMGPPLREALENANVEIIESYFENEAFSIVVDQIVEANADRWASETPHILTNVSYAMAEIETKGQRISSSSWNFLVNSSSNVDSWASMNSNSGKGLAKILEYCPTHNFSTLSIQYAKSLMSIDEDFFSEPHIKENGEAWYVTFNDYMSAINGKIDIESALEQFNVPGDSGFYGEVLSLAAEEDNYDLRKYLIPQNGFEDFDTFLKSKLENIQRIPDSFEKLFFYVMEFKTEWPNKLFLRELAEKIRSDESLKDINLNSLLEILCVYANRWQGKSDIAQEAMGALCQDGNLGNRLFEAKQDNDDISMGKIVASYLIFNSNANHLQNIKNSEDGRNIYLEILNGELVDNSLCNEIVESIYRWIPLPDLIKIYSSIENVRNIISYALKKIVQEKERIPFSAPNVINNFDVYLQILGHELTEKFILDNQVVIQGQLLGKDFDGLPVLMYKIYSDQEESENDPIRQFLTNKFQNFDEAIWIEAFNEESSFVELVIHLIEKDVSLNLSGNYRTALLNHVQRIFDGDEYPDKYYDDWSKLCMALSETQRATFIAELRDGFLRNAPDFKFSQIKAIFDIYGKQILSESKWEQSKADEFVRNVLLKIVRNISEESVEWMKNNQTDLCVIFNLSRDATKDTLMEDLRQEINVTEEEMKMSLFRDYGVSLQFDEIVETIDKILSKKESEAEESSDKEENNK
ncbi:P-loop NTPase fold protein [Nitrospinota bacterium]